MKRERLVILLGILVALVFFYLGLNEWLKTKEEQVKPPPIVVKPAPAKKENQQPSPEETPPQKTTEQEQKQPQKDLIAQKIKEEKKEQKHEERKPKPEKSHAKKEITQKPSEKKNIPKMEPKTYTVQVGAFRNKDGAQRTAERAKAMGYPVNIIEEDNFYKVRLIVKTDDINKELTKLRRVFGSVLVRKW